MQLGKLNDFYKNQYVSCKIAFKELYINQYVTEPLQNAESGPPGKKEPADTDRCGGLNINSGSSKTTGNEYHGQGSRSSEQATLAEMVAARSAWLRVIRCNAALPPRAFHVAAALADLPSWTATGEAWPSIGYLAQGLGISEKVVRSALRALTEAGHIEISQHGGRGFTNRYRMIPTDKPFPQGQGLSAEKVPSQEQKPCPGGKGSNLREKIYIPPIPPKPSPKAEQGVDNFTEFLSFFPKTLPERLNIASARRAYVQAVADGVEPAQVIAGARYYAKVCAGREPRYVTSPRKWLADARWLEAPQPASRKPVSRTTKAQDDTARAVETAIHGESRGDWVFVHEDSAAWCAWSAAFSHAGRPFAAGRLKVGEGRGRSFPTEFPPIPSISSSTEGKRNERRTVYRWKDAGTGRGKRSSGQSYHVNAAAGLSMLAGT
ncbi:helix-turn-helix domain-containing protein [Castellaniella sp.]|uniref:helix-turn-helix domain-containing protein n=1 Tax=Castellaniella sp. TaxID=1955812 RepID=UPI002AFEBBCE|nr:helix-turn-helix domain-containing protein [Castellaniella sp.]